MAVKATVAGARKVPPTVADPGGSRMQRQHCQLDNAGSRAFEVSQETLLIAGLSGSLASSPVAVIVFTIS